MPFIPKAEIVEQLNILVSFFESQPDGARLSWVEIEQATGVRCASSRNQEERQLVRRALHKLKIPYTPHIGSGIELSSRDNSERISQEKVRSVGRKIKRTARIHEQMLTRHGAQLNAADSMAIRGRLAVLGGMRTAISLAKPKALPPTTAQHRPMLPKKR